MSPTIYTSKELSKRRNQDSAFVARVLAQPKLWLIGDERALAASAAPDTRAMAGLPRPRKFAAR